MKPEQLADLDPFDLLDVEADRLDRHFETLGDGDWLRASRCVGWSVRDVLAHLAGQELYNRACLDGDVAGFYRNLENVGVGGLDGFNQWCVDQRRDLPVKEVLAEWRTESGKTRRRLRERGRDGTLETSVGPYPVGLQAFHYASEYATHADDIGLPVRSYEEPARTGWRARVGRFVLAERHSPVEVKPLNGRFRVSVGNVDAELAAADFVTATVDRLPPEYPLDPALRDALACLA
jgi:uncharacterized protein (TIGR03083 family)